MMTSTLDSKPAIQGGPKIRTSPWPPRFLFGEEEKRAVVDLFDRAISKGSHILGYNGAEEEAYMADFVEWMGGGFADGVNSGTNALYVAIRALDLPPGSEVIVPPVTDPGGIMPVVLAGLRPVVADSASSSYNTGAKEIGKCLSDRTSAIIVAHIAGDPVDMEFVMKLAHSRGIPVIEDCSQAHGAIYQGQKVGRFGAIASFSTMFGKHHASAGQGGIVYTQDEKLYWRARQVADRGKPFGISDAKCGNVTPALNCNMDELHAAVGRIQLAKLPAQLKYRRSLAKAVADALANEVRSIRLAPRPEGAVSAYWFLLLSVDLSGWCISKQEIAKAVQEEGIPLEPGYWHVPAVQQWYRELDDDASRRDLSDLPNVCECEANHLMMPFHEGWSINEVEDLVAALRKVENAFARRS